jgi:hypothetical protein
MSLATVTPNLSLIRMTDITESTEGEDLELGSVDNAAYLHQQPIEFGWHNIAVSRKGGGPAGESVLSDLSGIVKVGRLPVIMDPS